MTVEIPAALEALVLEKVRSGQYASASEVVEEALSFWRDQDRQDLGAVSARIEQGIDQLERGEGIDGDEAFRRLRERHRAHREQHSV